MNRCAIVAPMRAVASGFIWMKCRRCPLSVDVAYMGPIGPFVVALGLLLLLFPIRHLDVVSVGHMSVGRNRGNSSAQLLRLGRCVHPRELLVIPLRSQSSYNNIM